jgi:hypothetical protein
MQEKVFSIDWWKVMLQLEEDNNTDSIINEFLQFAVDDLGITKPCKIELTTDKSKTKTYGHYEPSTNTIVIYVKGRGTGDILRTLAHELVHRRQAELDLIKPDSGETGSPIENEANAMAGVLLRKFGEKNPMIYESLMLEKEDIFYPSEKFSIDNRINVSKRWKLPEGYNESKLQYICLNLEDPNNVKEYQKIAPLIFKLNPELRTINVRENNQYWDILMGVASRFNFDDIKFFIEDWDPFSKESDLIRKRSRDIEAKYNVDIQWIPSPKTADTIEKHFGGLNKLNEVGELLNPYDFNFTGMDDDGNAFYKFNSPKNEYSVGITDLGGDSYDVTFNTVGEMGLDTNEGVTLRVLSTVGHVMLDFIKRYSPEEIVLHPIATKNDDDKRRFKIYGVFLNKNIPNGYKLITLPDSYRIIKK